MVIRRRRKGPRSRWASAFTSLFRQRQLGPRFCPRIRSHTLHPHNSGSFHRMTRPGDPGMVADIEGFPDCFLSFSSTAEAAAYRAGLGDLERRRSFGGRAALHLKDGLQVLPSRLYNFVSVGDVVRAVDDPRGTTSSVVEQVNRTPNQQIASIAEAVTSDPGKLD